MAICDMITDRSSYRPLLTGLANCSTAEGIERARQLCREDLYFLLRYALGRSDADNDFVFRRCREVQTSPDGHLDLWAREHFKSTIITFAKTIQDVLRDPEVTVAIFSHTRPIAKGFLRQIKWEFESNGRLLAWFPDVLWEGGKPPKGVTWSLDDGIKVKRRGNPKEATVEAWGLVDGQPTSKHFSLKVYDDVVTRESVATPEMIAKTTRAWELSDNLGSDGGRERYIGTRYHYNDTYKTMIDRGVVKPRIHAATKDGKIDGEPLLLSREALDRKRRKQGPYTFACQMMQDPRADGSQGFRDAWIQHYDRRPEEVARGANLYITVDPASSKKKGSDYTVLWVWALAPDGNHYWVDAIRDRLNLKQRSDALFALHRKWRPLAVGYEAYGMAADIEHIALEMERNNYRFAIAKLGGRVPKVDRIRRLVPLFAQGRVWLPRRLLQMSAEGEMYDAVRIFLDEEYRAFPVSAHDDLLDAASRIVEPDLAAQHPRPSFARDRGADTAPDDDYNPFSE
ncbi:MAG: hypothetical protein Kilf2KO_44600 [Rhodospirillales bacterium]